MKNNALKLIALVAFSASLAFGYYHELDFQDCPNCWNSDFYRDGFARPKSYPRPSEWNQRGFSNAWGDPDYPDVSEQDPISGWERSVYTDHK
jgi:hypothetical protein